MSLSSGQRTTPSAEEDHVTRSKAPGWLQGGPCGDVFRYLSVRAKPSVCIIQNIVYRNTFIIPPLYWNSGGSGAVFSHQQISGRLPA